MRGLPTVLTQIIGCLININCLLKNTQRVLIARSLPLSMSNKVVIIINQTSNTDWLSAHDILQFPNACCFFCTYHRYLIGSSRTGRECPKKVLPTGRPLYQFNLLELEYEYYLGMYFRYLRKLEGGLFTSKRYKVSR